METTVGNWGNSLGIRIPAKVAEELGITANTTVRLVVVEGALKIEPVVSRRAGRSRRPLSWYLDQIPESTRESEIRTGPARGREIID